MRWPLRVHLSFIMVFASEPFAATHHNMAVLLLQDDSYLESYISTIGVDFVSVFLNLAFRH